MKKTLDNLRKFNFLFQELVKRDFKSKYKRTILGMVWSVLSPLLTLLVMYLVFSNFFGRNINHFVIYLFSGNIIFSFFRESTNEGMTSLVSNASIFTKVNVPKYLFLFSRNVTSLINFGLTLVIFFIFVAIDDVSMFSWTCFLLLYPTVFLIAFNLGMGLVLSALYVFFKDIQYLWSVFTLLLMYLSAIFYSVNSYAPETQILFLLNPVYVYIKYYRVIVIDGSIPDLVLHLLCAGYALVVFALGYFMYKKHNHRFLYYI